MESCNDQYFSDRNNNVHLYTIIIRLCNNCNNGHHHQWKCNTNVYPARTIMSERNSTCISNNIKQ